MNHALRASVATALRILVVAAIGFAGGARLQSSLRQTQELAPAPGAVLVHRAMKYDVSRPLASMWNLDDRAAFADCRNCR